MRFCSNESFCLERVHEENGCAGHIRHLQSYWQRYKLITLAPYFNGTDIFDTQSFYSKGIKCSVMSNGHDVNRTENDRLYMSIQLNGMLFCKIIRQ